jgi:hypothetical protein
MKINETGDYGKMKNQSKNIIYKLLFGAVLVTLLSAGSIFAFGSDKDLIGKLRAETNVRVKSAANLRCVANANSFNNFNFLLGKEFALALFDAERMDKSEESLNFTIVDLVYLIERLENQPEAAKLQSILKSVVRASKNSVQIRQEIETVAKEYLNRQKVEQKWYFSAGQNSMNLMFSSYAGTDAQIKKDLTEMQALVKSAPADAPKQFIEPMNFLVKNLAKNTFTKADYDLILRDAEFLVGAA